MSLSTATRDADRAANSPMVKTGISMHRDVRRKMEAVSSFRGLSFQEWAFAALCREMERDLPAALASLAD